MAHKKGVGSSKNGRESESKRLGVKIFGGQFAKAGNIIVRQRGTKHNPGLNVGMGKDHTLFALIDGTVTFKKKRNNRSFVSVLPTLVKETENKTTTHKNVKSEKKEVVETIEKAKADSKKVEAKREGKTEKPAAKKAAKSDKKADDLTKVEGIGPKSAEALANAGIVSFADLAGKKPEEISNILKEASSRLASLIPDTWPEQAKLAAEGKWEELKTWQDELDGGRK